MKLFASPIFDNIYFAILYSDTGSKRLWCGRPLHAWQNQLYRSTKSPNLSNMNQTKEELLYVLLNQWILCEFLILCMHQCCCGYIFSTFESSIATYESQLLASLWFTNLLNNSLVWLDVDFSVKKNLLVYLCNDIINVQ